MIAPPDSENERVSCCCQKLAGPKAKKRGASRDVHARYLRTTTPGAWSRHMVASTKLSARAYAWKYYDLLMRAGNSLRFCDNAEGFARMCLILRERVRTGLGNAENSCDGNVREYKTHMFKQKEPLMNQDNFRLLLKRWNCSI